MRALSLHQPWAWVVMEGIKRIENRRWPPYAGMTGTQIAIHSTSSKFDPAGVDFITRQGITIPKEAEVFGQLLGVATIDSCVDCVGDPTGDGPAKKIIDLTPGYQGQSKWFFGPYGWLLSDIVKIANPIPCRGYQRLWNLPLNQEIQLQVEVELARERARQQNP